MMASYQLVNQTDKVSDSSISSENRHGRSKAQMCLQKIIQLIVSFQSHCETSNQSSLNPQFDHSELKVNCNGDQVNLARALFCGNRGFHFDLNVSLCPPPETEESDSPASRLVGADEDIACAVGNGIWPAASVDDSVVHEKSSEGECDPKEVEDFYGSDLPATEANENDEEATEISEITNPELQSSEIDNNGVSEEINGDGDGEIKTQEDHDEIDEEFVTEKEQEHRSEGCLEMLLEAAKLISGECAENESESEKPSHKLNNAETSSGSKRSHCWMVELCGDIGDVSPVVRSKRGRNQVLPYRYRDSVLEPLNRLCRQKSSRVSTKRRSK